jgi:hypothetical protein
MRIEVLKDFLLADSGRIELAAQMLAQDPDDVLPQVVRDPVRLVQRDVDAGDSPVSGDEDGLPGREEPLDVRA